MFSQDLLNDKSTEFYTVTITLCNIMGEVIDVLYVFNAALVIYAILLVQNQASLRDQERTIEESKLNSRHLDLAVDISGEDAFRGNPEVHHNAANLPELPNDTLMYGHISRPFHDDLSDVVSGLQDSGNLNMGITLDDLLGTDFGFVTSFKAPETVGATTSS
ncbi:hypothetical protein E8E13_000194 [Curvularia kusanoi]|uniref:Uncharacterized protein n=1 Tax=Curvularia kusanoi TaxID=90978 RepID=A0A9P4TAP8_CURKU|nr:hypothetical protein E8E13_000194 [Curvularia kusanoi]